MKKFCLVLCSALLLLQSFNSFAGGFSPVRLNKVQFVSSQMGWIAGDQGTILKTTDGGVTWSAQTSGTTQSLTSLCFTDEKNGTAVGDSGIVIRTTDGGSSWLPQFTAQPLSSVAFTDADNGVAGGESSSGFSGVMYYTGNGGKSWQKTNYDAGVIQCLYYRDAKNIIAIELSRSSEFCRSTDGGKNWKVLSTLPRSMIDCFFTDANTGTAVGYAGWMLRTTDGGKSWKELPKQTLVTLFSVHFADAANGAAVGESGTILRTADGGMTWMEQTSNTNAELSCICFTDKNTAIAVGDSGVILRSTDGGRTWEVVD